MCNLRSFLLFKILVLFIFSTDVAFSQDALFTQFFNKRSFYNPAMTGIKNALAFQGIYKSQWKSSQQPAYQSLFLNIEDALPCSNFDWGFSLIADREGTGSFTTYQGGLKLSYSLTELFPSLFNQHNIRMGLDWSFGQHTINYQKLVFSDQIDPKYGVVRPSQFVAPNDGNSDLFFNPGFGMVWQARWNDNSAQSIITTIGSSVSNSFSLGGQSAGHSSSLLGIPNVYRQLRTSFFVEIDIIPYYKKNLYINISPLLFYQRQGGIDYWEIGTSIDISSRFQTGVYLHNSGLGNLTENTNWVSATASFNVNASKGNRLVLDITYSTNYTGLQNQVGPIAEIGISYYMSRSIGCSLAGKNNEVFYNGDSKCPIMSISPGRRKMYENIWYKN